MKNLSYNLFLPLLLIACSTGNEISLNRVNKDSIPSDTDYIEIHFDKFPKSKKKIEIEIYSIEYFSDDNYRFGNKYKFSDETTEQNLRIKIPKGKYVGTIQVTTKETIPFYKRNTGINTIYFGINEKRLKEKFKKEKCSTEVSYGMKNTKDFIYSNFCNDLNTIDKKYKIVFHFADSVQFNPSKTIAILYSSVAIGISKIFEVYPYGPFLLITSYFGIIQNDVQIISEVFENTL